MQHFRKLTDEILLLTTQIQSEFPTLYKTLTETPQFDFYSIKPIEKNDYVWYLNFLTEQLHEFRISKKSP